MLFNTRQIHLHTYIRNRFIFIDLNKKHLNLQTKIIVVLITKINFLKYKIMMQNMLS